MRAAIKIQEERIDVFGLHTSYKKNMDNLLTKTTELAMAVTSAYVREGDFVIDATCGNGHDTYALAKMVGSKGMVLAIDIQEPAITKAKHLIVQEGIDNVTFVQSDFRFLRRLSEEVSGDKAPSAVVFNLGYLPGGDKDVTTKAEDTCFAVEEALRMIRIGGIVTVVLYSGHTEGAKEKSALMNWAEQLPGSLFHVVYANMLNQKNAPPEILWITRKKSEKVG